MPRRNHGRRARDDGSMRANREQRDGRVLKVFRKVDQEDSVRLIGAIAELAQSNDIPPATTTKQHIAYIVDPRLMPRNFNVGFMTGLQIQKFATLVERDEAIESQVGYSVKLGKVALLQNNRRTVLIELKSDQLVSERTHAFAALASIGIAGFTGAGTRSGHRDPNGIRVPIATLEQPLAKSAEEDVICAIEASVDMAFGVTTTAQVRLGELETVTYQPR